MNVNGIDELVARAEIHDVVVRYCRAVDRRDVALLRTVFHADAIDEHGLFAGGVDEFIEWLLSRLNRMEGSVHSLLNHLAVVDEDRAEAETQFVARHIGEGGAAETRVVGGRYLDVLERRAGTWGIIRRTVVKDWEISEAIPDRASWRYPPGEAGPNDPSYERLPSIGTLSIA